MCSHFVKLIPFFFSFTYNISEKDNGSALFPFRVAGNCYMAIVIIYSSAKVKLGLRSLVGMNLVE
jgi:hypothetical protein